MSADPFTTTSLIFNPKEFHELHPRGGTIAAPSDRAVMVVAVVNTIRRHTAAKFSAILMVTVWDVVAVVVVVRVVEGVELIVDVVVVGLVVNGEVPVVGKCW